MTALNQLSYQCNLYKKNLWCHFGFLGNVKELTPFNLICQYIPPHYEYFELIEKSFKVGDRIQYQIQGTHSVESNGEAILKSLQVCDSSLQFQLEIESSDNVLIIQQ